MMRIWISGLILAVFMDAGSVGASTCTEVSCAELQQHQFCVPKPEGSLQGQDRDQATRLDWSCPSQNKCLGQCRKVANASISTPHPEDTRGRRGPVIECYPTGCCYEMISRTIWSCET